MRSDLTGKYWWIVVTAEGEVPALLTDCRRAKAAERIVSWHRAGTAL